MTEQVIFMNLCMVEDENGNVVMQKREKQDWEGVALPGGHVEDGESFEESVIREVREETGLTLIDPVFRGAKHWREDNGIRYVILMYKATRFTGELRSSDEGEVFWAKKDSLSSLPLCDGLDEEIEAIDSGRPREIFYVLSGDDWVRKLY